MRQLCLSVQFVQFNAAETKHEYLSLTKHTEAQQEPALML